MPRLVLVNPSDGRNLYPHHGWQPLSLACVAAATPPSWDVEIVDEVVEPLTEEHLSADLIGLTAFTAQAPRAYAIAARARAAGRATVLGGVHGTFMTEEALEHVDAVVTGEAEAVWPAVLRDLERGALGRLYQGGSVRVGDGWPTPPRRELFRPGAYLYATAQTTRGCPLNCSFCSVTAFNGRTYRMTDPSWLLEEFNRISERRVFVVDDNFIGTTPVSRRRAFEQCRRVADSGVRKEWLTQTTVEFGQDDDLPRMVAAAGCVMVLIGFESLSGADLSTVSKRKSVDRYRTCIERIHAAGIAIIGSFIVGIDGQDIARTVDDVLAFLEDTSIDAFNPTLLTPLPGTRDFARYRSEGRLLHKDFPADWSQYNLGTPTVRLSQCTTARLLAEYLRCMTFFEPSAMLARVGKTQARLGQRPAEAAYLWNRPWSAYYRRAVDLPFELPGFA